MSTILDALRRVQRESAPRELRASVPRAAPPPPPPPGRKLRWVAVPVVLVAAGGALAYFELPGIDDLEGLDLMASLEAVMDLGRQGESEPSQGEARATAAVPAPTARRPPRAAAAPRAPAVTRSPVARGEAPPSEAAGATSTSRSQPTPAPPSVARIPPSESSTPEAAARQARDSEVAETPARAATRASAQPQPPVRERGTTGVQPRPTAEPPAVEVARAEPELVARVEPESLDFDPVHGVLGFPDLSVESVRWHPQAGRREARVLLDHTRPIDAREGDIIAGVSISRIEPGAVELRMGETTRRIAIEP